jgi:hypothetical protein
MIGPGASAIELGEINVQSALGQPLRASIAFALQPSEQLGDYCVSLRPTPPATGVPSINNARISVANGVISLAGRSAINEPMASLRLEINCPYTPHLIREFTIFLNPASSVLATTSAPARVSAPVETTRRRPEPVRAASRADAALAEGERYRIQPGDTLSEIAQRIDNRSVDLRTAANEIFVANPGAFINDDPNLLKAGFWITIPESTRADVAPMVRSIEPVVAQTSSVEPVPAESPAATYDPIIAAEPSTDAVIFDDAIAPEPIAVPAAQRETVIVPSIFIDPGLNEALEIGDVIIDEEPQAAPAESAQPEATGSEANAVSWGWWFGGAALLLGGLAMFGRRRSASPPNDDLDTTQEVKPKRYLDEPPKVEVVESHGAAPVESYEVNYNLNDDSPTQENLAIDVDLNDGTGLNPRINVDVPEDLSVSSAAELDVELPAEARLSEGTMEQEVTVYPELPVFDQITAQDDYDMSVIVDVTKLRDPKETTERDLRAVVVHEDSMQDDEFDEANSDSDGYTISQEVDYSIVEQGYEHEELTATQALSDEIELAAAELVQSLDEGIADRLGETMVEEASELQKSLQSDDETDPDFEPKHIATVTPIDTAVIRAGRELDNTIAKTDDETTEMSQAAGAEDITTEMPVRTGKRS